jgi:molecular chaperone GrpE
VVKAQKFGVEKFAKNLLPVVDSLEKALESAKDETGPLKEGMEVTYKQLIHALDLSGMTPINAKGEKFDPAVHQAIVMVPAAEGQLPGTVAAVFQTGWKIHERVLRPAMVSVVQG